MSDLENEDGPMTEEQRVRVSALTASQMASIDACILRIVDAQWRKVAYVAGFAMTMIDVRVPDVLISERIQRLVAQGQLESRGDLRRMRYSEIRLRQAN